MANFNLADYETVEERIRRLYELHPDARIVTKNLTTLQDRQVSTWVVQAKILLPVWTLPDASVEFVPNDGWYVKATGLAFEVDGAGMTQKTSALETCETSAIGRALANMNLSGNRRASREEMAKVATGVTPKAPVRDWLAEAEQLALTYSVDALRQLWVDARAAKQPETVLAGIQGWADVAGKS
jgi:hypothetical protein